MRKIFVAYVFFVASGFASLGLSGTITLPPETAEYKAILGVDLARGYCLTCHSADYVTTQPPGMSQEFWLAEVKKMQQIFGAPIPNEEIPPLVNYLVRAYGNPKS